MGAHLLMINKILRLILMFFYFQFRFYLLLKNVCVYQRQYDEYDNINSKVMYQMCFPKQIVLIDTYGITIIRRQTECSINTRAEVEKLSKFRNFV